MVSTDSQKSVNRAVSAAAIPTNTPLCWLTATILTPFAATRAGPATAPPSSYTRPPSPDGPHTRPPPGPPQAQATSQWPSLCTTNTSSLAAHDMIQSPEQKTGGQTAHCCFTLRQSRFTPNPSATPIAPRYPRGRQHRISGPGNRNGLEHVKQIPQHQPHIKPHA
jgi:hypothetical protein